MKLDSYIATSKCTHTLKFLNNQLIETVISCCIFKYWDKNSQCQSCREVIYLLKLSFLLIVHMQKQKIKLKQNVSSCYSLDGGGH